MTSPPITFHTPRFTSHAPWILAAAVAARVAVALACHFTSEDYLISLRYAENLARRPRAGLQPRRAGARDHDPALCALPRGPDLARAARDRHREGREHPGGRGTLPGDLPLAARVGPA